MADGVALGKGTVKIKILKNALRVITAATKPGFGNQQKDTVDISPQPATPVIEKNHRNEGVISLG